MLWREWHRRRPSRWSVAVWGLFGVLSGGFSLWAIVDALGGAGPRGREAGGVISGLQVSAGLLLLSVSAVTSLAEERQRGSLDVLLATPLSTRSIVLGKWWGAFRGVPPLTVLPVLIAAAMATHTGFALSPVLIGVLVVAYGAAITSLGLALATWLPRMDRAIGLTAGLYVVVLIAPSVGNLFGKGPSGASDGFAAASRSGRRLLQRHVRRQCRAGTTSGSGRLAPSSGSSLTAWSRSACCWLREDVQPLPGRIDNRSGSNPSAPRPQPRPGSPTQSRRSTSTSDPARPRAGRPAGVGPLHPGSPTDRRRPGATSSPPCRRRPGVGRPPRSRAAPWWPGEGPSSRECRGTSRTLNRRLVPPPSTFAGPLGRPDQAHDGLARA